VTLTLTHAGHWSYRARELIEEPTRSMGQIRTNTLPTMLDP
jgi:hypothetical protein